MPEFIGKTLIVLGLGIVALGIVVSWLGKWPGAGTGLGWLGKLPGDLFIKRDNVTVYFPPEYQYHHQHCGESPPLFPPETLTMFTSAPVGILLLIIGMGLGSFPASVHASDRIRVALAERAGHVTVVSAGDLRLELPSGDRVEVASGVTIIPKGHELQVDDRRVRGNRLAIQGTHEGLQVTIQRPSPDAASQQWMVYGGLDITVRDGYLLVVNLVDLEDYVAGVVSSEVNPGWHKELLRTQAVAARTYVLHKKLENTGRPFDVYAGVQDQVYTGRQNVNRAVLDAVRHTRGQVLTYEGRPIFAVYSSTTAGRTEDAMNVWSKDLPYLKGVDCPFDQKSPRYEWQVTIPFDEIQSRLKDEGYPIGWLATLTPYRMTNAGRVKDVRILHSPGRTHRHGPGVSTAPRVCQSAQHPVFY